MLAREASISATLEGTSYREQVPLLPCCATVASMAFLAAMSGILCLTGPAFMVEFYDYWTMPSGSITTCMGLAVLDLILLVVQEDRQTRSGSCSNSHIADRSTGQATVLKSSYGSIPEKIRGRTYADTLMWRCAVPQRAGPEGGADGLVTKS